MIVDKCLVLVDGDGGFTNFAISVRIKMAMGSISLSIFIMVSCVVFNMCSEFNLYFIVL